MAECHPDAPTETIDLHTESISLRNERPYAGRVFYLNEDDYKFSLAALKEALPKVSSAYRPSGKTTIPAMVFLPLTALLVLVLIVVLGVMSRYVLHQLPIYEARTFSALETGPRKIEGVYALLFDLWLAFLVLLVPVKAIAIGGRWLKNRNAILATVLTGLTSLGAGMVLFFPLPVLDGNTVAFSNIVLNHIPIQWLIILGGSIGLPVGTAFWANRIVKQQKFCEASNVFLKRLRLLRIDYDFCENALALLKADRLEELGRLPLVTDKKYRKHCIQVELWGHARAATAYLELKVLSDVRIGKKDERAEKWLFYSGQLPADRAAALLAAYPERL